MADRIHTTVTPRRCDPLAMKIYSAFLGNLPRIVPKPASTVFIEEDTPFHSDTLRRQIRRATGSATRALDEARERLSRSAQPPLAAASAKRSGAAPMVLVGSAAVRRRAANVATRTAA